MCSEKEELEGIGSTASANKVIAHKKENGQEQLLIDHLQNVADLTQGFTASFDAGEMGYTIGLGHDIGKASSDFQKRIGGANISVDHSTAGAQYIDSKSGGYLGKIAAYCISGHHSGLPDGGSKTDPPGIPTLCGRLKKEIPSYQDFINRHQISLDIPQSVLASFMPTPGEEGFSLAFLIRMLYSALVDADWLDTEAFMNGEAKDRGGFKALHQLLDDLNSYTSGFENPSTDINKKRTELLSNCRIAAQNDRGLFSLTAPTGSGKTISSLAFALPHAIRNTQQRIIYVIPYNTIIEQNAQVFESIFEEENVIQHHSGISYDSDEGSPNNKKHLATENWDAPIIVTSSVRFFESLFANRSSACRKLHNIANSVIVFDEAQMIPLDYLLPCIAAMKELVMHYKSSIVLATATQSSLNSYFEPLAMTEITKRPSELYEFFRRVTFENRNTPFDEDELIQELNACNQVLCIVNTRKRAQSIAEKLSGSTFHLSTTMYPAHRSKVLKEIRERLRSERDCRVVSTSMIEAGVDVDFPALYREKAGLDSVIQAAGRCNREGKRNKEDSLAIVFTFGDDSPGYIKQNVAAFEHVSRQNEDIGSLEAIETYFEKLRYFIGKEGLDKKETVRKFNEGLGSASWPFKEVAQEFRIIEDDSCTVLVNRDIDAKKLIQKLREGIPSKKLFRALQQYSISLYRSDIKKLWELGALEQLGEELFVLAEPYYNDQYGVSLAPNGGKGFFV